LKVTDNINKTIISKVTNNRTRIRTSIFKEAEGEDQMTNQSYNAITVRSLGTMNLNAGRSKKIISQEQHMSQSMEQKPQIVCFSHATRLKNNKKIFGCWTVAETIT
jgi:hypothetical protein